MAKRRFVRLQGLGHRACGPFSRLDVKFRLLISTLTPSEVDNPHFVREPLVIDKVETILGCKPGE